MTPAGAGAAIYHDHCMAQLRTGKVAAGINFPIDNDAAANAGTQGNGDSIVGALQSARHIFAIRSRVGIVFHNDLFPLQTVRKHLYHGSIAEGQVVGKFNDTGGPVYRTRRTHANPGYIVQGQTSAFQRGLGGFRHGIRYLLSGFRLSFCGSAGNDLIVFIDNTNGDIGAAQVDSEIIHNVSSFKNISGLQS